MLGVAMIMPGSMAAAILLSSTVLRQNLIRTNSLVVSNAGRWSAFMAMPASRAVPVARSEPRTRTALVLESIARAIK